jgi:hypothetical protein
MSPPQPPCGQTETIRRLNDALRTAGLRTRLLITAGVAALSTEDVATIMAAVAHFDDFNSDNDPHGEHDCARLSAAGQDVIWKIDYYDLDLTGHSPDPSDPLVTTRVLTIMLAAEY